MTQRGSAWIGLLCGLACVAPVPAGEAFLVGGPTTIVAPGHYRVVRNITAPGVVLDIQASDVTLDLNGFTVESTHPNEPAIRVHAVPRENVSVRGGTIRAVQTCLFADRVTRLTLADLSVSGCAHGLILDDNDAVTVERNRIGASTSGVLIDNCKNCRVAGNTLIGGLDAGLSIGIAGAGEISGNTVIASIAAIRIGGAGLLIRDNVVRECGTALELSTLDSRVEGNLLSSCRSGLVFGAQSAGNVYRGNVARGNGTNLSDRGAGNTSHGDNYLPDLR